LISAGDMLFDVYVDLGVYTVFHVREKGDDRRIDMWRCDMMQICLRDDTVLVRAGLYFTERYLNALSPDPY
jgi:hypothetical protein